MNGIGIVFPTFMKVLKIIKQNPNILMAQISLFNKITYSHVNRIKNELVKDGFLTEQKIGRDLKLKLTESGVLAAEYSEKLINLFDNRVIVEGEINGTNITH